MVPAYMQNNSHRSLPTLVAGEPLVPAWRLTQAQFESQVICAAVDAVMVRARLQLQASDAADQRALDRLRDMAARGAPASTPDPQAWAAEGVQKLLGSVFQNDVMVGELPGIARVVLVKRAQIPDGMSLGEVLRRVHMRQVEDALAEGMAVPAAVLNEYRESMERMHVLPATTPREQLH